MSRRTVLVYLGIDSSQGNFPSLSYEALSVQHDNFWRCSKIVGRKNESRISFLDGLRGVAILLVVLYHAYTRWPEIVPYGNTFAKFPVFAYGSLGVQLFFIISGFVIVMTLETCITFRQFIIRRWLRLFPAMFVCSMIIFATAPLFPERPNGEIFCLDILPGLTFVNPGLWTRLLGSHVGFLEGAFWSLFVEVKFYVIFGLLYFIAGWRKAVVTLLGLFCLSMILVASEQFVSSTNMHGMSNMIDIAGFQYYGWFSAGIFYYKFYCEKKYHYLVYAMSIAFLSALAHGGEDWSSKLFAFSLVTLFTVAVTSARVQGMLSNPFLLFIGFISYPLYLLHENMMVALIVKIGQQMPGASGIFVPIVPIIMVVGLGWFVAVYLEPWLRKRLQVTRKLLAKME